MDCLICFNSTYHLKHPRFKTKYHVCSNCGFIFKDKKYHLSLKEEFNQYEMHENSIQDERYVAFFENFLNDAVFPYTNSGKKVLDFGSGPSPVLAQIMERDYQYDLTIYDKFYAPETNYQTQTYDLITCTEVMEHIEDPREVFKKFKKLLATDGILSIMTMFAPEVDDNFFGWHYLRDGTHISFFTKKAFEILAGQVGLEIIYTDHYRYITFKHI